MKEIEAVVFCPYSYGEADGRGHIGAWGGQSYRPTLDFNTAPSGYVTESYGCNVDSDLYGHGCGQGAGMGRGAESGQGEAIL